VLDAETTEVPKQSEDMRQLCSRLASIGSSAQACTSILARGGPRLQGTQVGMLEQRSGCGFELEKEAEEAGTSTEGNGEKGGAHGKRWAGPVLRFWGPGRDLY